MPMEPHDVDTRGSQPMENVQKIQGAQSRPILDILKQWGTIVCVGCSVHEDKPSHAIPKYMKDQGYKIIPVNPNHETVLGEKCYHSLRLIPQDLLTGGWICTVFRPSGECKSFIDTALDMGCKAIWLPHDVTTTPDVCERACEMGVECVLDECMRNVLEQSKHAGINPCSAGHERPQESERPLESEQASVPRERMELPSEAKRAEPSHQVTPQQGAGIA
ncbi:putative CoA-binding protein [Paratrimastix pyriformis]|uniref:CoA-binding protein n=1 Tax=Paratrimastix pyriformis TaxID=342808 RepID=A0ABQ8U8K0_9EUKA|nr:putative CoA-binding protein [Paratrimastix pyriformis]